MPAGSACPRRATTRPGLQVPDAGPDDGTRRVKGRGIAEIAAGAAVLLVAVIFLAYAMTNSGRSGGGSGLVLTARFDRIDGLAPGADVRIAGVKVGSITAQRIDPQSFLAVLTMNIDSGLRLPDDSSAEITSEGLLGGKYVALVPGGSERNLSSGSEVKITQSAVNLESLLGRFIFSMSQGSSTPAAAAPAPAPAPAPSGRAGNPPRPSGR
nr:outer membrane lipid asymmetry maintenance protein MlaD [Pararoseomonas baculiformis]